MPRGDTRKLVLVMGYTSLLATVLLALGWAWFAFSDTTEQGQKYAQQKREYREKREAREHEKVMAEKRLKEAHIRERNGMSPFPESQTVTKPVPAATRTVCTPVRENEAVTRLTAAQPGFGQCITLPGSSTRQLFFLMLNSPPKEITGRASFAHMREEMEADKIERRARCMAKTGDAEYCEAEMRKRVGVRVGEPCLTMDSPDRCVSYLKGKTHVPIVVHSNEPVSIHMN